MSYPGKTQVSREQFRLPLDGSPGQFDGAGVNNVVSGLSGRLGTFPDLDPACFGLIPAQSPALCPLFLQCLRLERSKTPPGNETPQSQHGGRHEPGRAERTRGPTSMWRGPAAGAQNRAKPVRVNESSASRSTATLKTKKLRSIERSFNGW